MSRSTDLAHPSPGCQVAVVIPTRNRARVLPGALESIRQQDLADFEVAVVDDASTDDTGAVVRGLGDARFSYHRLPDWAGANRARNVGVASTTAPVVTFLDSDDTLEPGRLREVVEFFGNPDHPHVHLSSFWSAHGGRRHLYRLPRRLFGADELARHLVAHALPIGGTSVSVRRTAWERMGGLPEGIRRMQDRDLLLRMARFSGAGTSDQVGWTKNRSDDSLSAGKRGYIEALDVLAGEHPELWARYQELFRYHAARWLLKAATGGRWGDLQHEWRQLKRSRTLDSSLPSLVAGYWLGKRRRKSVQASI